MLASQRWDDRHFARHRGLRGNATEHGAEIEQFELPLREKNHGNNTSNIILIGMTTKIP